MTQSGSPARWSPQRAAIPISPTAFAESNHMNRPRDTPNAALPPAGALAALSSQSRRPPASRAWRPTSHPQIRKHGGAPHSHTMMLPDIPTPPFPP